jgi:tetratricopeptide (TPR) repeat protein
MPPAGKIEVPSDLMRGHAAGETANARSRYVVRMTDGDQSWEIQVPEIATAYEVRIPLRGKPGAGGGMPVDLATLTAADKEIVGQREVDARARADEPEAVTDDGSGGPRAPRPRTAGTAAEGAAAPRSSYLLTLAKVKDLYRTRNYEIALVELVALEREYPNDERIMSMKGSLYEKLGRKQLAREAWEAVLALNPYNLQVAEALQRLGK